MFLSGIDPTIKSESLKVGQTSDGLKTSHLIPSPLLFDLSRWFLPKIWASEISSACPVCTSIRQTTSATMHPMAQIIQPHSDGIRLAWQHEYCPNNSVLLPASYEGMPKKTSMACHPTDPILEFRMFPMNWAIRGRPAGGTKEKRHPSGKCTLQKKTQESVHTLEMKVGAALLSLSPAE